MTKMTLSKKEAFLLRYSDYHAINTIAEHRKVLETFGFCWFGKIGKKPKAQYLDTLFKDSSVILFLFTKYRLVQCVCSGYSYNIPDCGIPEYYGRDLLNKEELAPSVYFKLESMVDVELNLLDSYVVKSSGKSITHDLNKSISSFYILSDKSVWVEPVKKQRERKKKTCPITIPNSCVYRINGICTNKRFVSYQFECERPNNCQRQKPILQMEE